MSNPDPPYPSVPSPPAGRWCGDSRSLPVRRRCTPLPFVPQSSCESVSDELSVKLDNRRRSCTRFPSAFRFDATSPVLLLLLTRIPYGSVSVGPSSRRLVVIPVAAGLGATETTRPVASGVFAAAASAVWLPAGSTLVLRRKAASLRELIGVPGMEMGPPLAPTGGCPAGGAVLALGGGEAGATTSTSWYASEKSRRSVPLREESSKNVRTVGLFTSDWTNGRAASENERAYVFFSLELSR
uniref:Uncharacterized protein n=1 Tax=Anopheles coluzzii TaxID=1518534 RepID=A0A8W7P9B1_ANOCL